MTEKNLGVVTAYGYAKSKGYTGTEDQFATLMASYADIAIQCEEFSEDAEAWAVGQRNGVDVPSTDPTYHNNAKYWAEQAGGAAENIIVQATGTATDKVMSQNAVTNELTSIWQDLNQLNSDTIQIEEDTITESNYQTKGIENITDLTDNVLTLFDDTIRSTMVANLPVYGRNVAVIRLCSGTNSTAIVYKAYTSQAEYIRIGNNWKKLLDVTDISQTTGTNTDKIMSQNAVTDQLALKFDKTAVKQTTGSDEDQVMSQKAVTNALAALEGKSFTVDDETVTSSNYQTKNITNVTQIKDNVLTLFDSTITSEMVTQLPVYGKNVAVIRLASGTSLTDVAYKAYTTNEEYQRLQQGWKKILNESDIKQTTGTSTDEVMSQKAVTDELETKADIDGAYKTLTAGNIYSDIVLSGVSYPTLADTTGGGADIGEIATYKKQIGGSLVWNQVRTTKSGTGTATARYSTIGSEATNLTYGHIYLSMCDVVAKEDNTDTTNVYWKMGNFGYAEWTVPFKLSNNVKRITAIGELNDLSGTTTLVSGFMKNSDSTYTLSMDYDNYQIFDLTQMFGTTIADYVYSQRATEGFLANFKNTWLPEDYYDYCLPVFAHTKPQTLVNTTSKNLIYYDTNKWTAYIVAGLTYRLYSNNSTAIGTITLNGETVTLSDGTFTAARSGWLEVDNASTAQLMCYIDYDNRVEAYEEYGESVVNLDGEVMKGIPYLNASNEIVFDGDERLPDGSISVNIYENDLSNVNWGKYTDGGGIVYYYARPYAALQAYQDIRYQAWCTAYSLTISKNGLPNNGEILIGTNYMGQGNTFMIRDDSISTATELITKLTGKGVYLAELITPTTSSSETFADIAAVNNWGISRYTYAAGDVAVPVQMETTFTANLKDKLEAAPDLPGSNGNFILNINNGEASYITDDSLQPEDIVQTTGINENKVMSQKAITDIFINDPTYDFTTFAELQKIVRKGYAKKCLRIGQQIPVKRGSDTIMFDVVGIDIDTPVDTQYTHSLTLMSHEAYIDLQFDARESLFYVADGLPAGTYNFKVVNQPWYTADQGKTFQFTTTSAIPQSGVIVLDVAYNATLNNSTAKVYASKDATTARETVTITEGSGGTYLGDVGNSKGTFINGTTNSIQRALLGSNNYGQSAIRQWLNSDAAAGSVWTPSNDYDRPPSWATTTAGFLNGLDANFVAVLGNVTKRTALNTVTDGGGYADTSEKIFLPSFTEVYGGNLITGGENTVYPYFSFFSDLSAAGTGADSHRSKYKGTTGKYWWLRSPLASYANNARIVYSDGSLNSTNAGGTYGAVPACCII